MRGYGFAAQIEHEYLGLVMYLFVSGWNEVGERSGMVELSIEGGVY